jgi:type II secretory pathway component PulF
MAEAKETKKNRRVDSLQKSLGSERKARREVIYGVYDSRRQPLFTRINDFFIDHSRVPLQEKAYFFHLLAVMLDAGVPLIQGLKMLARRTSNERFFRVLSTVAYNVIQGKKFSDSLAVFPETFGEMEVGIVRAGEAAGNMDKMLFKLSEQLDKTHDLQIKVLTSSIYPIAVFAVLLTVAIGMLTYVVPSLVSLLKEGGVQESELPFATRLLIGINVVITGYWWLILIVVVMAYLLFRIYVTSENGKYRWDMLKLKTPVIGTLLRRIIVLRFVSTLGILFEAGLPVIQSLTIIATSLSSEIYRLKVWQVISRVQQGEKISDSLADSPFLFPETVTQMLAVAEQTASIGVVSEKMSMQFDREIDNSLKRLTSLFEPLMIVLVGITVALLAMAILTPIFSLSQTV